MAAWEEEWWIFQGDLGQEGVKEGSCRGDLETGLLGGVGLFSSLTCLWVLVTGLILQCE